jgi:hypothetical protein
MDTQSSLIIVLIGILFGFWIGLIYRQMENNNIYAEINKMTQSPLYM